MSDETEHSINDYYETWDKDGISADNAEFARGRGQFFKFEVGPNDVRFLPPPRGRKSPFVIVHEHRVQIPGGGPDDTLQYACPRIHGDKTCDECDKAEELIKSGNPIDYEVGREMQPRPSALTSLIDRNEEAAGPQIARIGKKLFRQLRIMRENAKIAGNFTDPLRGYDLVITRKGTGKNDTEYTAAINQERGASPMAGHWDDAAGAWAPSEEQMIRWFQARPDLDRFLRAMSPEQISQAIAEKQKYIGGASRRQGQIAAPPPRDDAPPPSDDDAPPARAARPTAPAAATQPRGNAKPKPRPEDDRAADDDLAY